MLSQVSKRFLTKSEMLALWKQRDKQ